LIGIGLKMKEKIKLIEDYLDELFPNPKCQLNYTSDYSLLLAIMLSAQTTDKRVNEVTCVLFSKYKSLDELKEASISDLELVLRPLGNFRKKALYTKEIAEILANKYDNKVPIDREVLESLPGVGHKTVNVFFSEYCGIPAIGVDTHVMRVSKRLGLCYKDDDVIKIENKLMKKFSKDIWGKIHLQLVLFGRYHCTARNPRCAECRLKDICKYKKKK